MPLPVTVKNKKQGDIIRSDDWNIVTNEVDRLDASKANLAGAVFTGPLTINVPANGQPQLSLSGGNWDTNGTEGDLKIGSATHRLKIGVATGGGGAGDVRIRALGGTNRLLLGGGTNDTAFIGPDYLAINDNSRLHFGAQVRQMVNLWGTEYGIGVQAATLYFRSHEHYAWFRRGVHNDGTFNGGGGTMTMRLNNGGDLLISGRLDVGAKSFVFRRFENLGDNITRNTQVPASEWNAGIVGFKALGGNINETTTVNPIIMGMYVSGGLWHIRADFATHIAAETWYVDVLFVHVGMSSKDGGNWNTY